MNPGLWLPLWGKSILGKPAETAVSSLSTTKINFIWSFEQVRCWKWTRTERCTWHTTKDTCPFTYRDKAGLPNSPECHPGTNKPLTHQNIEANQKTACPFAIFCSKASKTGSAQHRVVRQHLRWFFGFEVSQTRASPGLTSLILLYQSNFIPKRKIYCSLSFSKRGASAATHCDAIFTLVMVPDW